MAHDHADDLPREEICLNTARVVHRCTRRLAEVRRKKSAGPHKHMVSQICFHCTVRSRKVFSSQSALSPSRKGASQRSHGNKHYALGTERRIAGNDSAKQRRSITQKTGSATTSSSTPARSWPIWPAPVDIWPLESPAP